MKKIQDAWVLLRIPFSIFLMPIFWFALLNVELYTTNFWAVVSIFLIIHLLVYPASNGYNSYFDKDEESIGGLEKPPEVNPYLFYLVVAFDVLALLWSLTIGLTFAVGILAYLLVSKAYSWDKIRLKKYPITSTLVVTLFQGAFIFMLVQYGISHHLDTRPMNLAMAVVSTLFLLGSYPITQIYQHDEDQKRGDRTLSILLGKQGTFLFSGILFGIATITMFWAFIQEYRLDWIIVYTVATLPILVFFTRWMLQSKKDPSKINFSNTMTMNKLSSICLSVAFIVMKLIAEFY